MAKHTSQLKTSRAEEKADESVSVAPVGTLARGLTIMDVLLASSQPLTLADVAAKVGLDQSTTLRLLRALEAARQVLHLPDGKRYLASPKALRPLSLFHPIEQLRRESAPLLRELANKLSKTVVLVVYFGLERVVLDVLQSHGSLSPYYESWLSGPLHASGPGKALLFSMDTKSRKAALGSEPYAAFTDATIRSWVDMENNLNAAKPLGVVSVCDEHYEGLTALAANFFGDNGNALGCVVVTDHSSGFEPDVRQHVAKELANCTQLMPFQAASLRQLEVLSGG